MKKSELSLHQQKKIVSYRVKRELGGFIFLLPGFIFVFLFMIYPIFHSLFLSFTSYNFAFDPTASFIGIKNYVNIFSDRHFITSLKNTVVYSVLFFPSIMVISLAIAILLNKGLKGTNFFRTSIFLPVVVPISLSGIMFQWILNDNFGMLNFVLREIFRLPVLAQDWLSDPLWAMVSIVGVSLWKFIGIEVILFLAGLQAIPKSLYEAATVDGVNGWQSLIYITLPNLKETFIITGLWAIIISVKVYELPVIMTQGGPGTSTLVLYQYMWNNAFVFYDMGYASAIGFVMGVIILLLAMINMKINRETT